MDSQGFGDVAGQSPQAPGGPDAVRQEAGLGPVVGSVLRGGSAGQPGQLQGAGEEPLHSTSQTSVGVLGEVDVALL